MLDANATVNLTLPAGAIAVLMQGLDELPHRVARPVFEELRRQIAEQHPAAFDLPATIAQTLPNGHDARE